MEKITNCPNNTFDCGVNCGLYIAIQAVLKVLKTESDNDKRIKIMKDFLKEMNAVIYEKHLEHMNSRYNWDGVLEDILKKR